MTRKRRIYVSSSDGEDVKEEDSDDGDFAPMRDYKSVSSP